MKRIEELIKEIQSFCQNPILKEGRILQSKINQCNTFFTHLDSPIVGKIINKSEEEQDSLKGIINNLKELELLLQEYLDQK